MWSCIAWKLKSFSHCRQSDLVHCLFVGIYFGWVTPLMQQGYRKSITEKDVWKLDTWDQIEILSRKCAFVSCFTLQITPRLSKIWNCYDICRFQKCWTGESHMSKPWLLRALNGCVGGRYILISHDDEFIWFPCSETIDIITNTFQSSRQT